MMIDKHYLHTLPMYEDERIPSLSRDGRDDLWRPTEGSGTGVQWQEVDVEKEHWVEEKWSFVL